MSGRDGDAATEVMIGCLETLGPWVRPLVVGEPGGRLAEALRAGGAKPVQWLRMALASSGLTARPWPQEGACDVAFVRLPKAKAALDFALHAAASRVPAGGLIAVFGSNDEGVKSATARLEVIADSVETYRIQRHARVITGRRRGDGAVIKGQLADWRTTQDIELGGGRLAWVSYPGVFAKGGLDEGTRLLIAHLPDVEPRMRVLDFAAGSGVIGRAILQRQPEAELTLLDADALAIEAARENVPGAQLIVGDSLSASGTRPYELIVSNPPLHQGVAESHAVLSKLVAEAPDHLAGGGRLVLVVQRRVAIVAALEAGFGNVQVLADDGRFTVVAATRIPKRR